MVVCFDKTYIAKVDPSSPAAIIFVTVKPDTENIEEKQVFHCFFLIHFNSNK